MSEALAYALKLPNGKLVPAAAAEPDGIVDIVASVFGVTSEHLEASLKGKGGSVVRVKLTEVQDDD